jgi:hypothetical protein
MIETQGRLSDRVNEYYTINTINPIVIFDTVNQGKNKTPGNRLAGGGDEGDGQLFAGLQRLHVCLWADRKWEVLLDDGERYGSG